MKFSVPNFKALFSLWFLLTAAPVVIAQEPGFCDVAAPAIDPKGAVSIKALSPQIGVKRLLLIRVNFADDPVEPISAQIATNLLEESSEFYLRNSFGKFQLGFAVTPLLTLPDRSSFGSDKSRLMEAARIAARSAGYDTEQFDFDAVRYRDPTTTRSSAVIGGKGIWLVTSSAAALVHEMGHNFGLFHANAWEAEGADILGDGREIEYGNFLDTMGTGFRTDFNVYYKWLLGWVAATNIARIETNTELVLSSMDQGRISQGIIAVRIPRNFGDELWLEHRMGGDLQGRAGGRLFATWTRYGSSAARNLLVSFHPDQTNGFATAGLSPGETFHDGNTGLDLRFLDIENHTDGPRLRVKIEFGKQPPGLSITPVGSQNVLTFSELAPFRRYELQQSDDLRNWSSLGPVESDLRTDGLTIPNWSIRFFRVRALPPADLAEPDNEAKSEKTPGPAAGAECRALRC